MRLLLCLLMASSIAVGGKAETVVTSAGGEAITLAASGFGVATSFAGSVYTAATAAALAEVRASTPDDGGLRPRGDVVSASSRHAYVSRSAQ